MDHLEFEKFVAESNAYLRAQNDKTEREFGVGKYSRFNYDMDRGLIWWSDLGIPKIKAKITVVGSISTVTNTWLWSWANPHFSGVLLGDIYRVRDFGANQGITKLSEKKWDADVVDGWEMTAVSARLLESAGAYRPPSKNGFLFLLLDAFAPISQFEQTEFSDMPGEET